MAEEEVTPIEGEGEGEDEDIITPIEGEGEGEETPVIEGEDGEGEDIKEEKEPTNKEMLARLEKSEIAFEKERRRVEFLTRKFDRPGVAPEIKPVGAKPVENDFDTNAEFVEALSDYKADQRDAASATKAAEQEAQNRQDDFYSVINAGPEKYADFNEVVRKPTADGGPVITPAMLETIQESDNPVDITYWLGQNVGESKRIAYLSPLAQAREIGKLEMTLAGSTGLPQKVKTKTTTPTQPVTGKTVTKENLADKKMEDFMSSRNKRDGVE